MRQVLNIAAGMDYLNDSDDCKNIEEKITYVDMSYDVVDNDNIHREFVSDDIFDYVNSTSLKNKFDKVIATRFFEHIQPDSIMYLLFLLHNVTNEGAVLKIIVPDFEKVALELIDFSRRDLNSMNPVFFLGTLMKIQTEIFNDPTDPHQSIWTKNLAKYYIESEGYFKITNIRENVTLNLRNWYMEITAERK